MFHRRRPLRARSRYSRRLRRELNFPQLRKEVCYLSGLGIIINQSDYIPEQNHFDTRTGSFGFSVNDR